MAPLPNNTSLDPKASVLSAIGISARDRAEIRRWLDWGGRNVDYLQSRKDLPDWPAAGKVDGDAYLVDGEGLVFLFNPNPKGMHGEFRLDAQAIGVKAGSVFMI